MNDKEHHSHSSYSPEPPPMKQRKFLMNLAANKSLPYNFVSAFNRKKAIQVEKTSKIKIKSFDILD